MTGILMVLMRMEMTTMTRGLEKRGGSNLLCKECGRVAWMKIIYLAMTEPSYMVM